jgi:hypothetical protein
MPSPSATKRCDRISVKHYMMKNEGEPLVCHLCRMPKNEIHGELLAFQQGVEHMCLVHLNCMKYTTIVKTFEEQHSRMIHEYQNVFDVLKHSKNCSVCSNSGASISCVNGRCDQVFHYHCAITKYGWDFQRKGSKKFQCGDHQNNSKICLTKDSAIAEKDVIDDEKESSGGLTFQHNLFAEFGGTQRNPIVNIPGNLDMSDAIHSPQRQNSSKMIESPDNAYHDDSDGNESLDGDDNDDDDDDSFVLEEDGGQSLEVMDLPLSCDVSGPIQLVHLERSSREDFWNISFQVMKINNAMVITVAVAPVYTAGKEEETRNTIENLTSLQAKDIIVSINGSKIGSDGLVTLRCILFRLKQEVDLVLEVIRRGL